MLSSNIFHFQMLPANVKIESKFKQPVRFFSKADTQNFVPNMGFFFQFAVYRTNCFYARANEAWVTMSWCLLFFCTSCPSLLPLLFASTHKLEFLCFPSEASWMTFFFLWHLWAEKAHAWFKSVLMGWVSLPKEERVIKLLCVFRK